MSINPYYETNPYNPAFGIPPVSYIHRYNEENRIMNEFCSEGSMPMSYMIIGARGMGKTVLMHELANKFETFPEWVVVRMNPNRDMVNSLMKKLSGHKKVAPVIKSAKINLSFFSLGVEFPTDQIKDEEDAITEIVKVLQADGKRLLIIVDEATNTDSMKAFASAYQNLIGQKLPVYMLMTGLYENISNLKNEKNLTFLYRMPRIFLEPLHMSVIADNYKDVFQMSPLEADAMAAHTKGFSYAFQLLGKLVWDNNGDYKSVLDSYRNDLYDMIYEKVWDEMSQKDKDLSYGIAKSSSGRIIEIRNILGWKPNELSPYKDRLIKKGIAFSPAYGRLDLSLPYFKGYIRDHYIDIDNLTIPNLPEDL